MSLPLLRVLAIPAGADKDAKGRGLGDDWLIATLGTDEDGTTYYVTTDGVHASELCGWDGLISPGRLAQYITDAVNVMAGLGLRRFPEVRRGG